MSERWTPAYDRMFKVDHHLAGDSACRRWAWLDLCHMAAWKDRTRILGTVVVRLERGELVASLRFLSERWGWSVKKVRDFLEILQHPDVGKLQTVRGTAKGTVYRIASYDTYANPGHGEGHAEGHEVGTGRAQVGHKEQQVTAGTNNVVAREVGALCQRLDADWKLKTPIDEWADDLRREPRYSGIDIAAEIRECAEWHEGKGKSPKAPDRAIRNWLKRATPTNGKEGHWASKL